MTNVAQNLREARALIERGWQQGAFDDQPCFEGPFTCVCALGAIMHANRLYSASCLALETLKRLPETELLQKAVGVKKVFGKPPHGGPSIVSWNDAAERTKADVIAAFDKAIQLAEQESA